MTVSRRCSALIWRKNWHTMNLNDEDVSMADSPEPVIMEEVTDPEERAAIRARRAR